MKKLKIIAAIAAVLTAGGIYYFLNFLSSPEEVVKTTVLVAAVNIPEKTTITADMLLYQEIPQEAILKNAVYHPEAVIGRMMTSDVLTGEQIVSDRLVELGSNKDAATLSYAIEPGMRAVTIAVNNVSGVGFMLLPGDKVDIVSLYKHTEKIASGKEKVEVASKILVQNVKILATDSNMSRRKSVISVDDESGTTSSGYATITLMVTPQEANELIFAENQGELCAILRSPIDDETVFTQGVTSDVIQAKQSGGR